MISIYNGLNTATKYIQVLLIIVLIAVVVIQRSCKSPDNIDIPNDNIVTLSKTEYELLLHKSDTIWKTEIIYKKGKPVPGKNIIVEIPQNIDTAQILKDYYLKRSYKTSVRIANDSVDYGMVDIYDTIHQNKIYSSDYIFHLKLPEVHETIIVKELPVRQIYLGGGMSFDKISLINSIYVGGLYKSKKEHIYGINIGLAVKSSNQSSVFIGGSMYWKIKWRRERTKYSPVNIHATQILLDNMTSNK